MSENNHCLLELLFLSFRLYESSYEKKKSSSLLAFCKLKFRDHTPWAFQIVSHFHTHVIKNSIRSYFKLYKKDYLLQNPFWSKMHLLYRMLTKYFKCVYSKLNSWIEKNIKLFKFLNKNCLRITAYFFTSFFLFYFKRVFIDYFLRINFVFLTLNIWTSIIR